MRTALSPVPYPPPAVSRPLEPSFRVSRPRRGPALLLTALLTALGGCGNGGQNFDLAANPDLAAFHPETRVVDFGDPAARSVLRSGWNDFDERWLGERSFVWGRGAASGIRFHLYRPGGRSLRFVGRPNPAYGDDGLAVAVVLNGALLETVRMLPGWLEYRVGLPEERLDLGANRLEFHYRPDEDAISQELQVAWDLLRMGPRWEYGFPSVESRAEGPALQVPFYSSLEYYRRASPDSRLRLGPIATYGDQIQSRSATLELTVQVDGRLEPTRHTITAADFAGEQEIDLGLDEEALVALSIGALPGYEPGRPSGLTIGSPILTGSTDATRAAWPDSELPARRPNVLVYLVDTLRADHLGLYGYDLPTSPRLDAFAEESAVFERAFTQSGWTRTSVASLFTGLLPTAHGVNGRDDALDPEALTLPALLGDAGYETAGWTTNGNVSEHFGFAVGFDEYHHLRERRTPEIHVLAHELNAEFVDWLDAREDERPFFAYLHASDPHDPYVPLPPFRDRFPSPRTTGILQPRAIAEAREADPSLTEEVVRDDLVALYDAEIAQTDAAFGDLLDALRTRGLYDDTVIVFLSDHGEEFLDHGRWAHGKTLYDEMIRMPLVIRAPGAPPGRIEVSAQHVDLLPTLAEMAGAAVPESVQGRSLGPWLRRPSTSAVDRPIRSYLDLDGYSLASLVSGRFHLVRPGFSSPGVSLGGAMLFDLMHDPDEQRDLVPTRRILAGIMLGDLRLLERGETLLHEPGEATIDDELRDRLRALGYIQ